MKVEDVFHIEGRGTVFAGQLETQSKHLSNVPCVLQVDGETVAELRVVGESSGRIRDLFSDSEINLTVEMVKQHEVWLISKQP